MCTGWPSKEVVIPDRQSALGERMISSPNIQWRYSVRTKSDISWDRLRGRSCMRAYVQHDSCQLPKFSATTAKAQKQSFHRQIQGENKMIDFILYLEGRIHVSFCTHKIASHWRARWIYHLM